MEIGIATSEIGQIGAAGIFRLLRSLGYVVSIKSKETGFKLQASTKLRNSSPEKIKDVFDNPKIPQIEENVQYIEKDGVRKDKDGIYYYKNIKICAERFPKKSLIDSLDLAQEKNKKRGRIIKFEKKNVTYICDNCNSVFITSMRILQGDKKPGHNKVCECSENLRYNENKYQEIVQKEENKEYIYSLQTENLFFSAGIGNILMCS